VPIYDLSHAYSYNFTRMEAVAVVIAININNLKTNKHTATHMTHNSVPAMNSWVYYALG